MENFSPKLRTRRARVLRLALRQLRELLSATLIAIGATLFINVFVAQAVAIEDGPSMQPNLFRGDRMLAEKVSQHWRTPQRGDVVVVARPDQAMPLVKRVIALPGEIVQVRDGHTRINGVRIAEPWITYWGGPDLPPTRVPDDQVFVVGDNRPLSFDSRVFGAVPISAIQARVLLVYWPLEHIRLVL